ncbi:glycoside hydrolase superfamily [Fusarium flagelliforme]|uniref:glycoside hydrolase superfamily n=1 Tax=Fusarium flagelliforme TaxID=2675880 RepID=UPI001E8DE8D4|nr:glycoside hydrolase superfamily [Fusarium flagelliforme]KAH7183333.1 glycoside hydrolase superfamily [Fusarium flagelliforme]
MKQFVSPLLAFGCLIGNVAAAWPNGPFKTSGRWIVNANDEKVNLAGANWPGHGEVMVPEGLQYQSIKDVLSDIKGIGMNAIRLTFATEMVDQIYANDGKDIDIKTAFEEGLGKENGTIVLEKVLKNNPSFTPETTRLETQVYDAIAAECLRQEIYINLDNHISEGKWCCGGDDLNTWWGDSQFDTEKWVRGGAYMAAHAKKWPAKVSQSLRNEPREPTNNAKLKEESYHWSDLYKYMRQGADAVHEADPEAIIVISGMNYDTYVTPLYSGEKMEPRGEVFNRDDFKGYGKDKLVLEIHTYENKGTSCPSLRYNLYNKGFQAMNESDPNVAEVFPVMLTEFGQAMNGPDYETAKTYVSCLSEYLPEIQASWFIWVIVGRYYTRQGTQEFDDSWGMKKPDWSGWRNDEYIETYLKPQIEGTLRN